MLPSQGLCIAIILLGRSAELKRRRNVEEWIEGARSASSFMAASLSFQQPVEAMLAHALATVKETVSLSARVIPFVQVADRQSMFGIARLLMLASPPLWLHLAVDDEVKREYIPTWDMDELSWLDPDLDSLLLEVASATRGPEPDDIRKLLGDAGESLIFDHLVKMGSKPLHVAAISDAFGYDIECRQTRIDRIEVKTSSEHTRGQFRLTRNEYEKAIKYGTQWRLLQVVFFNRAFVEKKFDLSNVVAVFQLNEKVLQRVIPADTVSFRWTESVELRLPETDWTEVNIQS